jgi:DNA polymerase III epsilon subunit-like protein
MLKRYVDRDNFGEKIHVVAYNSPFDSQFLREWFTKCGSKYYGWYFYAPDLCVMRIAGMALMRERHLLKNFQLGTVASYLFPGEDLSKGLHNALVDIRLTQRVLREIHRRLGEDKHSRGVTDNNSAMIDRLESWLERTGRPELIDGMKNELMV